jgi:pilus assembly protein CpaC
MRKDFQDTVRQFPILGSIPIIGTLFRSTGFQKEETELVIIVTPRLVRPVHPDDIKLPTDRVRPPDEPDLFLNGRTDKATRYPFQTQPPEPGSRAPTRPAPTAPTAPATQETGDGHQL